MIRSKKKIEPTVQQMVDQSLHKALFSPRSHFTLQPGPPAKDTMHYIIYAIDYQPGDFYFRVSQPFFQSFKALFAAQAPQVAYLRFGQTSFFPKLPPQIFLLVSIIQIGGIKVRG